MSFPADSKSDSRLNIIKAATVLFAKLGLDKCSTREIAKLSDTNISLISYHFGGKEGLYREVMRSYALEVKSNVQHIIDDIQRSEINSDVFAEYMGQFVENIIDMRLKNPEISKILSREKLTGLPYARDVYEEMFYPLILNFYRLIEIGQEKGFIKSEISPAFLFVAITEAIWGFYEIIECETKLSHDCKNLAQDPIQLKKQILNIYLTGVLK